MSTDRCEPLPPVTRLPGLLWVADGHENEARDRREAAEVRARQVRELRELQRPRSATSTAADPQPDLESLITADARSRPDAGRVLRTDCEAIREGGGRFSCTAVTSDLPGGSVSRSGSIGFPFRAIAKGRRLTWCRIAGRPAEGALTGRSPVAIPRACGG